MQKKYFYFISIILIFFSACKPQSDDDKKVNEQTDAKAEAVRLMSLQRHKVDRTICYSATLLPFEERHLAPSTPGKVKAVKVEVGDRVKRGQLLAAMDDTQLQQAQVQLNTLTADLERLEALKKTNSIAPQKYDQLKAQYEVAMSNVNFLKTNTHLLAPFSGVISGKYYESGEIYSGAPNPLIGKAALLSIVQDNKLKVMVAVSENYYLHIKKGMKANVISELYSDRQFEAKISNIYPTIDPTSRTFNVELVLDNADKALKVGMFVRANIFVEKVESILIPDQAVLKMQGANNRYVFVNRNGKAKRIEVSIGARYDNMVEVIADELKAGDEVVVAGQARLLDGDKLKIVR